MAITSGSAVLVYNLPFVLRFSVLRNVFGLRVRCEAGVSRRFPCLSKAVVQTGA
jgi:hypothetical protein